MTNKHTYACYLIEQFLFPFSKKSFFLSFRMWDKFSFLFCVWANRHFIQHFTWQNGCLLITRHKHIHMKMLAGVFVRHSWSFRPCCDVRRKFHLNTDENLMPSREEWVRRCEQWEAFCHFYWYIQTVVVFISTIFVFHYFRIKDDICRRKTFQLFSACRAFFGLSTKDTRQENFLYKSPLRTRLLKHVRNNDNFYVCF